jgi:hypothetical protein
MLGIRIFPQFPEGSMSGSPMEWAFEVNRAMGKLQLCSARSLGPIRREDLQLFGRGGNRYGGGRQLQPSAQIGV